MKGRFSSANALLAITACFLWSTAFVGVKFGLSFSKPLSFAGIRFILSGLILFPFCGRPSTYFHVVSSNLRFVLLVSLFQTFLLYALFYTGMTLVAGALGAIIVGSSPLISALVAHVFMPDDEMTVTKSLSIGIGILGVVIISISRQPWSSAGFRETIGVGLLLLASISSAFGNVIVARDRMGTNPLILTSAQIFIGGLSLLVVSIPLEGLPVLKHPMSFYATLLYLSFLSAVAFSIWFTLLQRPNVKVSELNLWKFIIPVFGALLSWIVLPEESPELLSIIGMLCVASSIVFYNLVPILRGTSEPPAQFGAAASE